MTNLGKFINKAKRAFLKDRQLRFGIYGIILLLLIVIFAPLIATENPYNFGSDILNELGENGHILGTNKNGTRCFQYDHIWYKDFLKVAIIST